MIDTDGNRMATGRKDNVVSMKTAALKQASERLKPLCEAEEVEDAAFADVIYSALSDWGITEIEFRDAFGLTEGAVHRWSTMNNLPQPDIRPIVLQWVRGEVQKKLSKAD